MPPGCADAETENWLIFGPELGRPTDAEGDLDVEDVRDMVMPEREANVPFGTEELIGTDCRPKDEEVRCDGETVVSSGFVPSALASDGGGRRPFERKEGQ